MPSTLLERLPLPSLRVYAAGSVALLAAAMYYAASVTSDPDWRLNGTEAPQSPPPALDAPRGPPSFAHHAAEAFAFMIHEPLCIWTLINMAYCLLALLGTLVQRAVFGPLRSSERQHVKDKFWNFLFYKFIFVFGVINVQYMDEVLLWCSWFTVLGFLHLLAQLCKDRFEYLSFSPTTPRWSHARLLALLLSVLTLSGALLGACVAVGLQAGINTFAFMAAECLLLGIGTLHVVVRYALHLHAARAAADASPRAAWDERAPLAYYTQLAFDMSSLVLELAHHLHMLLWSNIFLSMASLVILMQLRYLFHEIQARVRKHRMYLWVLNHMDRNYPMASREEVANNSDNCAICWERMESARKLPCSHLFHNSCLSSWLQQDTSCPTCRRALPARGAPPPRRAPHAPPAAAPAPPPAPHQPNHFFHFDGSRYVSWLPSFSVEVTRVRMEPQQHTTSQLDAMARQVQQLFPHYPLQVIQRDLQATRSVQLTVENILDGRLRAPPAPPAPAAPAPTLAVVAGLDGEEWAADEPHEQREEASAGSARFSKNSSERERILRRRKESLLGNARRRYLARQTAPSTPSTPGAPTAADTHS